MHVMSDAGKKTVLKYRRWVVAMEKSNRNFYRHGMIYRCVAGRAVSHGRGQEPDSLLQATLLEVKGNRFTSLTLRQIIAGEHDRGKPPAV